MSPCSLITAAMSIARPGALQPVVRQYSTSDRSWATRSDRFPTRWGFGRNIDGVMVLVSPRRDSAVGPIQVGAAVHLLAEHGADATAATPPRPASAHSALVGIVSGIQAGEHPACHRRIGQQERGGASGPEKRSRRGGLIGHRLRSSRLPAARDVGLEPGDHCLRVWPVDPASARAGAVLAPPDIAEQCLDHLDVLLR